MTHTLFPTQSEQLVDEDAITTTQDYGSDHPTNDDGDPLCTGKEDGQCGRVVDEPGGTCWQHEEG